MKNLLATIMTLMSIITLSQTSSPWSDDMTSIGQPDDKWRLITGQSNAGTHNGEMCYNVTGTYIDDEFYSFESDTLDLSLWSKVDVELTIASNLRNSDLFGFYYYDSATSSWSGYDISDLVGTYTVTIPNTTILLSFDLSTFSNGGLNGKYAHVEGITVSDPGASLPIELISFEGFEYKGNNNLEWITASEINTDYYNIEWSTDTYVWWSIGSLPAAGNSDMVLNYSFKHEGFIDSINYYRIVQYDVDGQSEIFGPLAIDNSKVKKYIIKTVNLNGQEVTDNYVGVVFQIWDDNSVTKTYQNN